MKKLILSVLVLFALAVFSNINAQETPPGAGDSDLRDNDIRLRSNELERIRRDAHKSDNSASLMNSEIDAKYPQIKEDFEGMQITQAAIIKAYTTGEKPDYKTIEASAQELKAKAKRLESNLFSSKMETDDKDSADKEKKTKSVRNLIVELDNAIGQFVSSTMFQNLRVVDPEVAKKAQSDLVLIMDLSDQLSKEADKMK